MIPISDKAKALLDAERRQVLRLTGTDGNGNPISITEADVMENRGFSIDRSCCNGEKLEIGTAIAAEMNVKLDNRTGKFNGTAFGGSELTAEIGVADWPAMETAKNLFVGTLEPAASPAGDRVHINGQTSNTAVSTGNVYDVAEHGMKVSLAATGSPYVAFGTNVFENGTMNGLTAGKTYTISFDYTAKLFSGSSASGNLYFRVYLYTAAEGDTGFTVASYGNIILYNSTLDNYGTEQSGTFQWTFTVPDDAVKLYIPIRPSNQSTSYSAVGDYFELRSMMLVEGDVPAAWTPAYEEVSEVYYMPCGVFVVDEQPRTLSVITITALDRMVKFDHTIGTLTFPCTVENLIGQCCTACGVTLAQSVSSMPNASAQITALPESGQTYTYRMLILWAAGVMGSNAYMDWNGQLRFSWYDGTSGYISSTVNRFSSDMYEDDLSISGFSFTDEYDDTYVAGTDDYAIDLSDNPLVGVMDIDAILSAIYNARQGLVYRPFSASSVCAPYLMPMDRISFVDAGGNSHVSLLTNVNLTVNGNTVLQAVGETDAVNVRAKPGSFTQNQETVLRRIQRINDSRMDTAIENATAQITGADGGYVRFMYDANDKLTEILIMDTEDVTTATKVWRWNSGGLGYSANGYDGPYALAMTQDGAIVADFITTGTLDGTKINAKLLNIVDANGDVVASFNDAIILGKSGQARAELDFNSFEIVDSSGNVIATIGDTASSDGYTHITEDYVGTGTQTRFELSQAYSSIVAIVSVTVDGVVADPSTYSLTAVSSTAYLRFTSAPASGAAIEIEYTVSGSFWHYDFGSRSSGIIGHKSMAHGDGNLARGMYSFASGEGLQAHQRDHHVFGSYNVPDTSGRAPSSTKGVYIEIVGNGDNDSNRSNARTLDWNGNEYIAGALNVGDAATTRENLGVKNGLIYYGTCDTAAATQEKAATVSGVTALFEGLQVRIRFANAQTYNGQPTLNVNSLGAKGIVYRGTNVGVRYMWMAGEVLDFVYDGTNFVEVDGSTIVAQDVSDLNDAVNPGFYSFASSASNRPTAIFTSGGSMVVVKYSDNYLTQFAVANNYTDFNVAMRKYRQGSFSDWQRLVPLIERTYYPAMQVGGISTSTGANTSSTNASGKARSRCVNHIPYRTGASATAATDYSYMFIMYDSNGDFTGASSSWLTGTNTVPECGEYRLLVKHTTITDFTGVVNDFITITDYATVQARFDLVFKALESLGWQE